MSCKVHFTGKHHWAKIEFRTLGKINLSIYLQYYLNWLEILSSWLSCSFMSCLLLSVVGLLKVEKLAFSVGGGWEILAAKLMSICVICNHCSQEKHNGRECLFLFFFFPPKFLSFGLWVFCSKPFVTNQYTKYCYVMLVYSISSRGFQKHAIFLLSISENPDCLIVA